MPVVILVVRLLANRVAIRVVETPDAAYKIASAFVAQREIHDRITTSEESDEHLSTALSDASGMVINVATYDGDFEVRRLQVEFRHDSGAIGDEDARVITFHLLKLTAGAPDDTWAAADFNAARNAFLAFWNAIKTSYRPVVSLTRTAFYREGPGVLPPQPPVNAADHALPGTQSAGPQLPPQVAITVTEKVSGNKKNWGRFYLPAPGNLAPQNNGRIATALSTQIADAADTMYEAWRTAGIPGVVYLPALPERSPTAPDPRHRTRGTFAARPASARTVDELQIDDIFDVIRTRRFDRPLLRTLRAIG